MARISKRITGGEPIGIEEVKQKLRSHIEKEYGGVAPFLKSEVGEKFGGMAIRPYLYDKGAVSFKVLGNLCEYFGIGKLNKQTKITRITTYTLKQS